MDYVNEVYPFVRVMHITHEQNPPPHPPPTPKFYMGSTLLLNEDIL